MECNPTRSKLGSLCYQFFFIYCQITLTGCVCISVSSSSCRAASTDIPDPLSPLLPIIHRLWQVFRVTSCVLT